MNSGSKFLRQSKSKTRQRVRWRVYENVSGLVVEHAETAAGDERRGVATAKPEVRVGVVGRTRGHVRREVVRMNRLRCQVGCADRVVGRQREGGDFVESQAGARQCAIEAADKRRGRRRVVRIE